MACNGLKKIIVSEENYLTLEKLGRDGDSFNDIFAVILRQNLQTELCRATNSEDQNAVTADTTTLERDYTGHE
jgi:hypothetical protein